MDLLPIIATLVYLFILTGLTYIGYRGTKNAGDFLLGGRKIHPMIMALSYGATFISTSAIVGFGGNAGLFGMSLLWLTFLNIFVGVFIAFIIFGKRTRKMGHNLDAHTFPELLGRRFQSRFIQGFSALLLFLFMPIYAAAVLKGGVGFMQTQFDIDFNVTLFFFAVIMALYVSLGGIKGVMYTDAFQGIIMFCGLLFLLIFVYNKMGGVTQAHNDLTNLMKDPAVKEQVAGLEGKGFRGWTNMPAFNSPYWWSVVSSIIMGVGIGVLAQPQLVVRFMTVKSNRELNRAVASGGVFILFATGVAFTVGALSNVLFFKSTGAYAGMTSFTSSIGLDGKPNVDNIIPIFIKNFLPDWFGTIFLLVLLAAAMSTLSSLYHTIGTSLGRDFFEKALGIKKGTVLLTRLGITVAIIFSAILAYVGNKINALDVGLIAQATSVFFALCAAAFLPTYIAALYSKRPSRKAAISSILAGSAVSLFWLFFIHEKNARLIGLCKVLFKKDSLLIGTPIEKLNMVDSVLIALPISIIVLVVVALLTKQDVENEHLDKCFNDVK
jgi:SSS family solute:Na+ symporter